MADDEREMWELVEMVQVERKLERTEGETGVRNLCKFIRILGYEDRTHFGAFAHDGSYGDLICFLEDNPGAVEAIIDWTKEQEVDEWRENLEAELPSSSEDEDSEEED